MTPDEKVEDALTSVVEEAIDSGMLPDRFVRLAWGVWNEVLDDKKRTADLIFEKILKEF